MCLIDAKNFLFLVGKGDGYMQSGKFDGTSKFLCFFRFGHTAHVQFNFKSSITLFTVGRTTDLKSAGGYFESSKLEAQNAVGK